MERKILITYLELGMRPMILLGKGAQVEALFALFGDSANLDAR